MINTILLLILINLVLGAGTALIMQDEHTNKKESFFVFLCFPLFVVVGIYVLTLSGILNLIWLIVFRRLPSF